MVHLPALPGSARSSDALPAIIDRAVSEARQLERAGFDAVIVENFGDSPFAAQTVLSETVVAVSVVVDHLVRALSIPVGVNVLRNDCLAAMSIAAITGAAFIRVNVLSGVYATDQGLITGRADELARLRARLGGRVQVAADVHVKHAAPISQPDIALAAEETAYRAGADALIVSGVATGSPADLEQVSVVRRAVPDRPLWIGSGVSSETVRDYLDIADAVIVGTSLKRGGRTTAVLDPVRVRGLVRAAR
jgi:membrane complex biogenesis BtpA family protein